MVAIVLYSLVVLGLLAGFFFLFSIPTCKIRTHPAGVLPSISIIIPARNEEANLPRLLASIAAQLFQPTEVIVVDDQSVDQTPAIAREYQATVLPSKPLPEGWVGKAWACYQGACHASSDLLIFLDADTYLAKDGLQKILDTYVSEPAVMSIAPYHETEKFHEQFSAFFNIIMTGSMNAFTMLGNALKPTGLFGPSLIVSRDQYFSIQGHAAVKDKILEHFFMAQIFITHQIPLKCFGGKGTLSFRMYPQSFHELIQGWRKAFAKGAGQTKALPLGLIIVWAFLQAAIRVTSIILTADQVLGQHTAVFSSWITNEGLFDTTADLFLLNTVLLTGTIILWSAWMAFWLAWKQNQNLESSSNHSDKEV